MNLAKDIKQGLEEILSYKKGEIKLKKHTVEEKVYCIDCTYMSIYLTPNGILAPRKTDYHNKNKYNDCKDYEKKKSFFKRLFGN